ncbi:MAG: sugar-transfer associated ATP-grasp domain-containing protein [Pseudomonadota bacterium]
MSEVEPDCLDVAAQRKLINELAEIKVRDLAQTVLKAAQVAGGTAIIGRFLSGMNGPGRLSIHECIYYRLFDPVLPKSEIGRFISSKQRSAQTLACNDLSTREPTLDKVLWDRLLAEAELPRPEIKAVFGGTVEPANGKWLDTVADLTAFLSDPANYPMLAKPNFGGRSLGVLGLREVGPDGILLHDGTVRRIRDIIDFIDEFGTKGYIFQEVLSPHPEMAKVTGGSLATMRLLLLVGANGVEIENITLKVPTAGAVADNYWRGNLMTAIDRETGTATRSIRGSGVDLEVVDRHPDTVADLTAFKLPDFDALRALSTCLAASMPEMTMQGWDVGITDRGYVPIEVNFGGDVNLQQLAHNKGTMTPRYVAHLKARGYNGPLPA